MWSSCFLRNQFNVQVENINQSESSCLAMPRGIPNQRWETVAMLPALNTVCNFSPQNLKGWSCRGWVGGGGGGGWGGGVLSLSALVCGVEETYYV